MKYVGEDRRVYGHLMTKFSRMGRLPQIGIGLRLRASCARGAPLLELYNEKSYNTECIHKACTQWQNSSIFGQ